MCPSTTTELNSASSPQLRHLTVSYHPRLLIFIPHGLQLFEAWLVPEQPSVGNEELVVAWYQRSGFRVVVLAYRQFQSFKLPFPFTVCERAAYRHGVLHVFPHLFDAYFTVGSAVFAFADCVRLVWAGTHGLASTSVSSWNLLEQRF